MPWAGNRLGTCSAWKEAKRDINDMSPIINNRERKEKMVRNVGDVYKVGRSLSDGWQFPGRSPTISH